MEKAIKSGGTVFSIWLNSIPGSCDGVGWVKPTNEIKVELECTTLPTGPGK